jgi:hypothetical protein
LSLINAVLNNCHKVLDKLLISSIQLSQKRLIEATEMADADLIIGSILSPSMGAALPPKRAFIDAFKFCSGSICREVIEQSSTARYPSQNNILDH